MGGGRRGQAEAAVKEEEPELCGEEFVLVEGKAEIDQQEVCVGGVGGGGRVLEDGWVDRCSLTLVLNSAC